MSPDKAQAMRNLADRIAATALAIGSLHNPVLGEGPLDARIAFVGEAPGAEEAQRGRPFVGQAGRLLDEALRQVGIDRADCRITNLVRLRPTKTSFAEGIVNRNPSNEEVALWKPFLLEELAIVRPKVIVCLGSVAAKALIRPDFVIGAERGRWFDGPNGALITATFHPAYVGRMDQLVIFLRDLKAAKRKI